MLSTPLNATLNPAPAKFCEVGVPGSEMDVRTDPNGAIGEFRLSWKLVIVPACAAEAAAMSAIPANSDLSNIGSS